MPRVRQSDLKDKALEHVEKVGEQLDQAVRKAGPFIEWLARIGIASKGITYLLLGGLAILAAVGAGAKTTSTTGMMQMLIDQPIGWVVFLSLAAGFAAFGLWQWLRAFRDPEREGTDWTGLRKRTSYFFSGLVNFAMVVVAIQIMVLGPNRDVSGDRKTQSWVALALHYPLGRWIIVGVGVGVLIYGLNEIRRGIRNDPDHALRKTDLEGHAKDLICWVGRIGIIARGFVFLLIGFYLMLAAWYERARVAKGQGGVLRVLEHRQYGTAILSTVAIGLVAYGACALVLAWHRRIKTH